MWCTFDNSWDRGYTARVWVQPARVYIWLGDVHRLVVSTWQWCPRKNLSTCSVSAVTFRGGAAACTQRWSCVSWESRGQASSLCISLFIFSFVMWAQRYLKNVACFYAKDFSNKVDLNRVFMEEFLDLNWNQLRSGFLPSQKTWIHVKNSLIS